MYVRFGAGKWWLALRFLTRACAVVILYCMLPSDDFVGIVHADGTTDRPMATRR
jgi:hypothetical protein